MKQLLTKLMVFTGIGALMAMMLQTAVFYRVKDLNVGGNQTLHAEHPDADLVFLGSSRAWAHFDPVFFEHTFGVKSVNIAVTGHSEIALATLRLENYLSKNKAPRFAIFNFDPMANADKNNSQNNFVIKNDLARYAFWPDKRDAAIVDYFKFDAAEKYIPAYAIIKNKMLFSHLMPKRTNRYTEFGYENNTEMWDTLKNPVTDLMKKHYFPDSETPAITESLERLHGVCRKHGIELLCIQTPVYKSVYDPPYFARTKEICARLKIPYIDMESAVFRNNVSYFYNSNHMNRKGVEKMNALFKQNSELRNFLESH